MKSNAEEGNPAIEVTFSDTEKSAGWWADVENVEEGGVTYKASAELENGNYCVQLKRINASSWRGDLKFDSSKGGSITLDKDVDKYLAIKFIGERPASNTTFKFEVNINNKWYYVDGNNTKNPAYQQEKVSTGGNHVYIINLDGLYTRVDNQKGEQYSGGTVSKLNFIFADANKQESYAIDWIKTFSNTNDIDAEWNDDVENDYAECTVINENTNKVYGTLNNAVSEASDNDVILINGTARVTGRCDASGKTLTIKANTTNARIKRNKIYDNYIMFLANSNGKFILKGDNGKILTLEGNETIKNVALVESPSGGTINMDYVKIIGETSQKTIFAKGYLNLKNVEFENCNAADYSETATANGIIFVGNNTLTLNNSVVFNNCEGAHIYIENYYITQGADFQEANPIIGIKLAAETYPKHDLVKNGTLSNYKIQNDGFAIQINSQNNIEVLRDVVRVNSKIYDNLKDAVNDAQAGSNVELQNDAAINSRIDVGKNVTITNAQGKDVVIRRAHKEMLFLLNGAGPLTIKGNETGSLTIDGGSETDAYKNANDVYSIAEVSHGGTLNIENITIQNNRTNQNGSAVRVQHSNGGGTLNVSNCTFRNITTCNDSSKGVLANISQNIYLRNKINFYDCTTNVYMVDCFVRGENTSSDTHITLERSNVESNGLIVSIPNANAGGFDEVFRMATSGYRVTHSADHYTDLKAVPAPTFTLETDCPWATYCVDYDALIPEDVRAYKAVEASESKITFRRIIGKIPANQGVVLFYPEELSENKIYTLQTARNAENIGDNVLTGTVSATPAQANWYAMSKSQSKTNKNLTFAPVNEGVNIPANRAYLINSTQSARFVAVFDEGDGTTTEVEFVENENGYKMSGIKHFENGRLIIVKNGKKYNAAGQVIM